MAKEEFVTNLMRALVAELHFQNALTASREMFGKSYFSLGAAEKVAVDQAVIGFVGAIYQAITPEWLAGQQAQAAMGFRDPSAKQKVESS